MKTPWVLYSAPGSGLGHLNRALAVCLELRELQVDARIVTNSLFAEGLARASRFPITRIAAGDWREGVRAYAATYKPALLVRDTFPRGLRGEWAEPLPIPAVYVARRLNAVAVESLFGHTGWADGLLRVVAAEQLSQVHESALAACVVPLMRLPGPIRLRPGRVPTAIPAELERILDAGHCCLVVHGGPAQEVAQLVGVAREFGQPTAIAPWGAGLNGTPPFEYWPAGNVMERAVRVVSGAGYNAMADMMFDRHRHTAVPFPRRFDDQAGRLDAWQMVEQDGTRAAAQAIAELLP